MGYGAARLVGCTSCGALQAVDVRPGANISDCRLCGSVIERGVWRRHDVAFACSSATLVLLVPANLLEFMSTSVLGTTLHSHLWSSATVIWGEGCPWLAIVIATVVIVMPVVRFTLLTAVLAATSRGVRSRWIGPAFRRAQSAQAWAMSDVFLLGLWIAYARLHATIDVVIGPGAICFVLAGLLTMVTRATVPEAEVWSRIGADRDVAGEAVTCSGCGLAVPVADEGCRCPRCAAKVTARRPGALEQTTALTMAALSLYVLANVYPMATVPLGLEAHGYTVLQGVGDLFAAHLLGLALLVFTVSFVIPLFKLIGLGWCVSSVVRNSGRHLGAKTRVYHLIEEIGRWSMTDPFAIACFVPLIQYNSLVYGRAEVGAETFSFVVVVTMIAARRFDPRLLWDGKRL